VPDPTATRAQLFANVADEFVAYDFATVIWHRPLLNILFGEEVNKWFFSVSANKGGFFFYSLRS